MGTYDDFNYGIHRDRTGRPKATYEERAHATEDMVRDIVKGQAQPGRGMSQVDIAREVSRRRDGDAIPFTGKNKRNVQNQVHHILKNLEQKGEIRNRGPRGRPQWGIHAPLGEPKGQSYDTANDPERLLRRRGGSRGAESPATTPPAKEGWVERQARQHRERLDNAAEERRNTKRQTRHDPLGDLLGTNKVRSSPQAKRSRGQGDPLGDLLGTNKPKPSSGKGNTRGGDPLGDLLGLNRNKNKDR